MPSEDGIKAGRVGAMEIRKIKPLPGSGGMRAIVQRMEAATDASPLKEPGPTELSRIGFMPFGRDLPSFFELPGGQGAVVRIGMHNKIIPAAAVAAELERECEKVRVKTHAEPGAKLRRALRDQVLERMCASAFHATRASYILLDAKNGLLFASGAPTSMLAHSIEFLCKHVGGVKVELMDGASGINAFFARTTGLLMEHAEQGLSIGPGGQVLVALADKAKFVSRETGETLAVSRHAIAHSTPVRAALKEAFEGSMARLVATMPDGNQSEPSFLLYMDLSSSGKIAGVSFEEAQEDTGGEAEARDGQGANGETLLMDLGRLFVARLKAFRLAATVIDGLFADREGEEEAA